MAQSHRLRIGRYSTANQVYLITTVCWNRQPIFQDFPAARSLVQALQQAQPSAYTLCYVVMPDHLHWLMQLRPGAELSATVKLVKSIATRWIKQRDPAREKVWQPGFHDHQLRREEDMRVLAKYVVANPVRAGLVSSVRYYSLWDAVWL